MQGMLVVVQLSVYGYCYLRGSGSSDYTGTYLFDTVIAIWQVDEKPIALFDF